jgi:hypothetical protein
MDKDSFGAGDSSGSRRGTEYDVDDEELDGEDNGGMTSRSNLNIPST